MREEERVVAGGRRAPVGKKSKVVNGEQTQERIRPGSAVAR